MIKEIVKEYFVPVKYILWYVRDVINWQSEPYNYMLPKWGRPDGHPYRPYQAEIQLLDIILEMRAEAKDLEEDTMVSLNEGSCNSWIAKHLLKYADKLEQL